MCISNIDFFSLNLSTPISCPPFHILIGSILFSLGFKKWGTSSSSHDHPYIFPLDLTDFIIWPLNIASLGLAPVLNTSLYTKRL